jgi:hypothetical protein
MNTGRLGGWEMRRIIAIAGIAGLSLGLAAMPAGAGTNPSFESTPSSGPAGTVIHASDNNFNCDSSGATVHVEVFDAQEKSVAQADTEVTSDATWAVDVKIPNGAEPGQYVVTAICTDGELRVVYADNPFTVTAPPATTTTTSTSTTTTVAAAAVTTTTTVPVVVTPAATPAAPVVAAPKFTG